MADMYVVSLKALPDSGAGVVFQAVPDPITASPGLVWLPPGATAG
jgi:hypothetical protein